jgi:hypothetical protein
LFYCCVIDHAIQYYNFYIDTNQLPCHEERLLNLITKDFKDVFPKELPPRLPLMCNIDHKIDLILGVSPVSIAPYRLNRLEEDEITTQLKDYLRMGHIQHSKSPSGVLVILVKKKGWNVTNVC